MILWDEGDNKRGVMDRYEILLVMNDDATWKILVWVRKTLVERADGLKSKEDAQAQAEKIVGALARNTRRLEGQLFPDEFEDQQEDEE